MLWWKFDDGARTREDALDAVARQRLGRHHVAVERHEPAAQPGHSLVDVAVGGHQNIARRHSATVAVHGEAVALAADGGHGRARMDLDAGAQRALEQAQVIEAGVERAMIGNDGAAAVIVGAELAPLTGARQHLEGFAEMAFAQCIFARHALMLPGRQRANEAAAMNELAGDLLLLDQREDPVEGGAHVAIDGGGAFETVPLDQLAEAVLQRAADIAGIA
jgi:hypothetical protein